MFIQEVAVTFNLIGALFGIDPTHPQFTPILERLNCRNLLHGWPVSEPERLATVADAMYPPPGGSLPLDALRDAYLNLIGGPVPAKAHPWGSVYLDDEHVLYGSSTLRLQEFLKQEALVIQSVVPGPEDHFASLCWLAAWLANQGRRETLETLLNDHLLTWALIYLDRLEEIALEEADQSNPAAMFYVGAARLSRLTLQAASIPLAE